MLIRRLLPTTLLAALAIAAAVPAGAGAAVVDAEDDIADAPWIFGAGPHLVDFDTDGATSEDGEPTHHALAGEKTVWVKWNPAAGGMMVNGCPDAFGVYIRVYRQKVLGLDSVKALEPVYEPELKLSECDGRRQTIKAPAGKTYYVVIARSKLHVAPDPGGYVGLSQALAPVTVQIANTPKTTGTDPASPFTSITAKWFTCRLDGEEIPCLTGDRLGARFDESGTHVLEVRGVDAYLNRSPWATWNFTVDADPPQTYIDFAAPKSFKSTAVTFHSSADAGVWFKCRYDDVVQYPCTSPWTIPALKPGQHKITITARDKYGNVDPTPAVKTVTVG